MSDVRCKIFDVAPQITHHTSHITHLISFSFLTLACPTDDARPCDIRCLM